MSAITRETATILAALRFWQLAKEDAPLVIINLSIDGGRLCRMQNQEIDALCERIYIGYNGGRDRATGLLERVAAIMDADENAPMIMPPTLASDIRGFLHPEMIR